ncbi:MAG: type II secretion system F family protein [Firmicutes bacterium]|nr:type II secretion system F family protein [Bacillota bacterium]
MTTYHYKGLSVNGAQVEGIVDAVDEQEAVIRAKANCHVVLSVTPERKTDGILNADIGQMLGGGKIKDKELSLLCSQLAIELKAGLPVVRSLELVAENEPNKTLKKILKETAEDVQAGHGLADSFALRGPTLPGTFIETIRAGEESGRLDECFSRLKTYYKNSGNVKSKVTSAMIYPILLIVVAVVVVAIIMIKAVPVFEDAFADLGSELPGVTKALIAVSHFFQNNILIIIAVLAAVILALKLYGRTEAGKATFARIALTFPGIELVNKMNGASQFASTMATMLASGLPMVQAAQITANVVDNYLIKQDIRTAAEGVVAGNRLGDGLKKSKWLPALLLEMTGVGEETGNLEDTLNVISEYYTDEVSLAVERALGILEPVIVMVMAGLVVFILLSVYLPLFSMYGSM